MKGRQRLVILGSDGFAAEVADLVRQAGELELTAFAEDADRERCGVSLDGLPVLWIDELAPLAANHLAVCAIARTPLRRRFVLRAMAAGFSFATVRHPAALFSPTARLGTGAVVGPRAVVAAHGRVGDHVILNRGALVGHHASISDYVTIGPGANLAGGVEIGEGALVGMGALILDGRSVGAHSVVGAGAVVTSDVPDRVQVLGVPARVTKTA